MNDQIALKTNRYALRALKDRRAEIAGEICQLKIQLKTRKLQLVYIDASILLLDPSVDLDKLPAKRTIKHVRLFKRGELGRLILGALREANGGPLGTHDITAAVIDKVGFDQDVRLTVKDRVRLNLNYLERGGRVSRTGKQQNVRWSLA
jgi:hypothetical protein